MSTINLAAKEISVKIVYYGPGLCGKTTSLQYVYSCIKPEKRPQMVSLATDVDRTIFFDFLPVAAYRLGDFLVRLQLYTVPGQVFYNSTRKLVLNGADGVVFVGDSQREMMDGNLESLQNLEDNLRDMGLTLGELPHVLQYNKRDLDNILSVEEIDGTLNRYRAPYFATIATRGDGVQECLKGIAKLVIKDVGRKGLHRRALAPETPSVPSRSAPPSASPLSSAYAAAPHAPPAPAFAPPRPSVAALAAAAPPMPAPAPTHNPSLAAASPLAAAYAAAPMARAPQASAYDAGRAAAAYAEAPSNGRAPGVSFAPLWGEQRYRQLAERIEALIAESAYAEAVLAASAMVDGLANELHESNVAMFVLLKGVSGPRYLRLRALASHAQAGRVLSESEALFALHLVSELALAPAM